MSDTEAHALLKLREAYSILHLALQKIKRLNTRSRKLSSEEEAVRTVADEALNDTRVWTTITKRII